MMNTPKSEQSSTGNVELHLFKTLIDDAVLGNIVHRDFKPLYVNRAFVNMLGFDSVAEFLALESFEETFAADERDRLRAIKNARMGGAQAPSRYEYKAMQRDGSLVTVLNVARIVQWPGGPAVHNIVLDVTDMARTEELERQQHAALESRVAQRTRQLSEANQLLKAESAKRARVEAQLLRAQKMELIGHLTGGIAHDFNNMLGSIMGYTDLALTSFGEKQGGKLEQYLREVHTAGERARDLVSQMLAFSRGASSAPQALDIGACASDAMVLLKTMLPRGVELKLEVSEQLPLVLMDPVQLTQVMMNVCMNACEAMTGHGVVRIQVTFEPEIRLPCASCRAQCRGPVVVVAVHDNGAGIVPSTRERMFDPFFTTKDIGESRGMGLSMVHGIMHDHDGHLAVDTEVGRGTTFTLLLPVSDQPAVTSAPDAAAAGGDREQPARVLVVDDEVSVGAFIGELLEFHGYRATVVSSSLDALRAFAGAPENFDLVITDQTMPDMNGDELARKLRELRADCPLILCTGYSEAISADTVSQWGNTEYLLKPLDTRRLLSLVATLLSGSTRKASPTQAG